MRRRARRLIGSTPQLPTLKDITPILWVRSRAPDFFSLPLYNYKLSTCYVIDVTDGGDAELNKTKTLPSRALSLGRGRGDRQ